MPASIEIGRSTVQATRRLSPAMQDMDGTNLNQYIEQSFALQAGINSLTLINDGAVPLRIGFDLNPITDVDEENAVWTFNGTWTDESSALSRQQDGLSSTTAGDTATLNPGTFVEAIGYYTIAFNNGAIHDIEVNDGSGWRLPSTVDGLTRNDGASGTDVDTWDATPGGAGSITAFGVRLEYIFPYAAPWLIRVTNSGNNNNDGSVSDVRISGGTFEPTGGATWNSQVYPGAFQLQPGESIHRAVRAGTIHHRAESASAFLRVLGEII